MGIDEGTYYQLWCYYETADVWKMEGFFRSKEEAFAEQKRMWMDVHTPCMPDWRVIEVRGVG